MLCISHRSLVHLFDTPSLAPTPFMFSLRSHFHTISTCTTCTYAVLADFLSPTLITFQVLVSFSSFHPLNLHSYPFSLCALISHFLSSIFHLCLLNSHYPHHSFWVISLPTPACLSFNPSPHYTFMLPHFPLPHVLLSTLLLLTIHSFIPYCHLHLYIHFCSKVC